MAKKLNQKERIIQYLREGPKDGYFFTYGLPQRGEKAITEYRTRISELEKEGYNIQRKAQEGSNYVLFILLEDDQLKLF